MNSKRVTLLIAMLVFSVVPPFAFGEDNANEVDLSSFIKDDKKTGTDFAEPESAFPKFSFPKMSMPKLPTMPAPKMPKLKMPKLDLKPKWNWRSKPAPERPSAWNKLSSNTKTFFKKTTQTLMPWTASASSEASTKTTGSQRIVRRQQEEMAAKKSFFPQFFARDEIEEPEDLRSVSDFLKLPKPAP